MKTTLTDRGIRALEVRVGGYEVADSKTPGLSLRVLPSGAKRWSFRFRDGHRWGRIALGPFPALTLADARDMAADHLRAVHRDGVNPSEVKRREREVETVARLVGEYLEIHAKRRKRSWKADEAMLKKEVPRTWLNRPVVEVTRRDIRDLIEAKAATAPIQANRLRALLHKMFAFAVQRDMVPHNPVTGTPRPGVEKQRDRVLTEDEVRVFWAATEAMDAPMRAFWRLRLVTAQRSVEVSTMRWEDLDGDWWTIPADLAKNGLSHRVPLSRLAREIVDDIVPLGEYVCAGARGKRQQSEAAALIPIEDFRGHDLRRTAASLMAGSGVPRLVIAKLLNHVERSVTAVYDRHSYDQEKRQALDTWANRLEAILGRGKGAEVVPIGRGRQ